MGIPLGRLANSRSRRNLLLAGVVWWSCTTILCCQASSYWVLSFARMGIRIGEAFLAPCAYSLIADYFPCEKRSLPLNIIAGGIMLGSGVANICGGLGAQYAEGGVPREIFLMGNAQLLPVSVGR